jgi:hypothetical protein
LKELLIRFVIGGVVVSVFALLGDLFRPKSFAGLFGAAPSVALATLSLTIAASGRGYASSEGRSMVAGAIALFIYASLASRVMMSYKSRALLTTIVLMPVWFASAFALWLIWLR